jgi:hypothetical protein
MSDRLVGVQVGAASFMDEGVGQVLDTVQERAAVNALFLASPTWNTATGGRPEPGRPFADHGVQQYEAGWHGGNYATVHPEYYVNTILGAVGRAPEYPDFDMLASVIPEAKRRGMKTYALMDESSHARALRSYPNFLKCLEVDIWNKPARRPCFNNPDYRNWHLGMIEDYIKSYDLDGILWSSERPRSSHAGADAAGPGSCHLLLQPLPQDRGGARHQLASRAGRLSQAGALECRYRGWESTVRRRFCDLLAPALHLSRVVVLAVRLG